LETVVADPAEQIRVWLPQVLVRVHLADPQLAADLGQRWAAGATEACLIAPDLDRFIWQLALTHPASAAELLRRMVESPDDDARNRAGKLVALLSVRGIDLPAFDNPPALARALGDPASRKGVADFLAQLVDELPDGPASRDGAPRVPDRRLLIQLLSDDDPEVRDVAATFARYMNQSLDTYSSLIGEAATSKAFQEHPAHLLHALHSRTSERPATVLDVCKQWIDHHHEGAGDIRTAYYVVDLVLALYTQSPPGSPERIRCLDILDRLIEAGAAN